MAPRGPPASTESGVAGRVSPPACFGAAAAEVVSGRVVCGAAVGFACGGRPGANEAASADRVGRGCFGGGLDGSAKFPQRERQRAAGS
jgi:hypothetical protein